MNTHTFERTCGEIVAADYRAAVVFDRFGIDFCCGGKRTVGEACRATGIDPHDVRVALDEIASVDDRAPQPDTSWATADLISHIVDHHHAYARGALPRIGGYLEKLVSVHGARHPELEHIANHFAEMSRELQMHMFKEERVLFPYIGELDRAAAAGAPAPPNVFGTVRNPVRMMEAEHVAAGNELAMIRELTGGYRVPADACTTYWACFSELEAFDTNLRQHIHLENNLLFPRALAFEATVLATGFGDGNACAGSR